MGLFGGLGKALKYYATPDGLQAVGATLKDISAGGSENFSNVQQQQLARRQLAQKQALAAEAMGLFGGSDLVGASTGGNPGDQNAGTPSMGDIVPRLARLQAQGLDIGPYVNLLKLQQPDIAFAPDGTAINKSDPSQVGKHFANRSPVNGTIIDLNDPNNTNRAVPEAPVKGAMPIYDNMGHVVDWNLPQGAQGALAAASEASQTGQTRGTMLNVPRQGGGTAMMTGGQYLASQGQVPGLGLTQTPAEAAAANLKATAQAGAQVSLPQANQTAQQALDAIDALKSDPALKYRTGIGGVLPAIPGTPGADFDARVAQLKGKLFMEAYAGLKGGGQITEVEGKKATEAIGRLNTTQTQQGFMSALDDLKSVIQAGQQRAAQQAGQSAPRRQAPAAAPSRGAIEAEMRRRGLL